jgi:hypothetical protein
MDWNDVDDGDVDLIAMRRNSRSVVGLWKP